MEAKVFVSNKSQAVRLPKQVAFPPGVESVEVVELGASRLLTPVHTRWDSFFAGPAVSDDFMAERAQPAHQERESL
ncbi:MAG: type II toxin-antitoxin system VapB family antitoxin [Sulfuricella sp.]